MAEKIPGKLLRAARQLLDWDQLTLADLAGCSAPTITRLEVGDAAHLEATRDSVVSALEAGGVTFIPATDSEGAGVRWSTREIQREKENSNAKRDRKAAKSEQTEKPPGT